MHDPSWNSYPSFNTPPLCPSASSRTELAFAQPSRCSSRVHSLPWSPESSHTHPAGSDALSVITSLKAQHYININKMLYNIKCYNLSFSSSRLWTLRAEICLIYLCTLYNNTVAHITYNKRSANKMNQNIRNNTFSQRAYQRGEIVASIKCSYHWFLYV